MKPFTIISLVLLSFMLVACKPKVPTPATPETTSWYKDVDGDTYGNATSEVVSTIKPDNTYVADKTDCNDANAAIHPGAVELLDSVDENCDGFTPQSCADLTSGFECTQYPSCEFSNGICSEIPKTCASYFDATSCNDAPEGCVWFFGECRVGAP